MRNSASYPSNRRGSVAHAKRALVALWLAVLCVACARKIGDNCSISTDCSTQGDRICDVSQPGGYCTQLGCRANGCPDSAACVLFGAAVPGCSIDEREFSRAARSQCMNQCSDDSDCRDSRYVCVRERVAPWNARILDDKRDRLFCVPRVGPVNAAASPAAELCKAPISQPLAPKDLGAAAVDEARDNPR
jgi:hypothetical protein